MVELVLKGCRARAIKEIDTNQSSRFSGFHSQGIGQFLKRMGNARKKFECLAVVEGKSAGRRILGISNVLLHEHGRATHVKEPEWITSPAAEVPAPNIEVDFLPNRAGDDRVIVTLRQFEFR